MATKPMLTVEQYEQLPVTGVRTELVDGEVIELSTGVLLHDLVRDNILIALHRQGGGHAVAEREFRTTPSRVRRADAVWYAAGRIKFADLARSMSPVPDLAVEVVSPNDRAVDIRQKVHEYLDAGVEAVWVIYLETREADVWNRGRRAAEAGVDTLTADCLPGFALPIDAVFPAGID